MAAPNLPEDVLSFVKGCLRSRRVYWSYHVNMRLQERRITRDMILEAIDSLEVIESYPDDKYYPSVLLRGSAKGTVFHLLTGLDRVGDNIRVVTAYRPDPSQWDGAFRVRRYRP